MAIVSTCVEWANQRVEELLRPEAKADLERLRAGWGSNRVYRIPRSDDSNEFVILKLPPGWGADFRRWRIMWLRNLVYGERVVDPPGKRRAEMEIARYREWTSAGLPVPALIPTTFPHVRIIEGLPFPTLGTLLQDGEVPPGRKLEMVGAALEALGRQHQTALDQDNAALVHPEPNLHNLMFDPRTDSTYWIDLEHPDRYQSMTVEDMAVRSLRTFVYDAMHHFPGLQGELPALLSARYGPKHLLSRLADSVEHGLRSWPMRLTNLMGWRRESNAHHWSLIQQLRAIPRPRSEPGGIIAQDEGVHGITASHQSAQRQ